MSHRQRRCATPLQSYAIWQHLKLIARRLLQPKTQFMEVSLRFIMAWGLFAHHRKNEQRAAPQREFCSHLIAAQTCSSQPLTATSLNRTKWCLR